MKFVVKLKMALLAAALLLTGCHDDLVSKETTVTLKTVDIPAKYPWIASKNTTRINSDDLVEAAVIVSQTVWMATNDNNRPGGIVLVSPEDWRTALVSANLIHFPNNGPVLFVDKEYIPKLTLQEMKRLKPAGVEANQGVQVILVGNISERVETQVKKLGLKADRIRGDNPASLAQAIDAYYAKVAGELPSSVLIGSMDDLAFTAPAVNWIAHMPEPLLFVTKTGIPKETEEALRARRGNAHIYILGPESVISEAVAKQLQLFGHITRIEGKDPYENAVAFTTFKDSETGFGWGINTPGHNFSFVGGDSIELAIAAAPLAHLGKHAALLVTAKDQFPDSVRTYLNAVQPKYKESPAEGPYNHAWIIGSASALPVSAQAEIDELLEIQQLSGEGHGGHGHH